MSYVEEKVEGNGTRGGIKLRKEVCQCMALASVSKVGETSNENILKREKNLERCDNHISLNMIVIFIF